VFSSKDQAPSSGAVYATVTGRMFSYNYATSCAAFGGTAVEQYNWVSSSSLIGKVSSGKDAALGVTLSVGSMNSVSSLVHSYAAPSVVGLVSSLHNRIYLQLSIDILGVNQNPKPYLPLNPKPIAHVTASTNSTCECNEPKSSTCCERFVVEDSFSHKFHEIIFDSFVIVRRVACVCCC
jgi:hypothetical protein